MNIDIQKITLHVYDFNEGKILKTKDVEYNVPFIDWITKLVSTKEMRYVLEYKNFFQDPTKYDNDIELISERIFNKMAKNLDIEKADMAYVECYIEKKSAIVGLKLNYTTHYTHRQEINSVFMERNTNSYPIKIQEAFIYYASSKELYIAEKTFEEEGKKVYYLSKYALEIENATKSQLSKIKSLKHVMNKFNDEIYENDLDTQLSTFNKINNTLIENKTVTVNELVSNAYQTTHQQERILELLERKKISAFDTIENNEKIMKVISTKKFKNELGIEVKIESHLLEDNEFVELQKQADDSYNIIIKNVKIK